MELRAEAKMDARNPQNLRLGIDIPDFNCEGWKKYRDYYDPAKPILKRLLGETIANLLDAAVAAVDKFCNVE